jgi:hypothetical protein
MPELNANGQVQNVCFAKVCSADGGFGTDFFETTFSLGFKHLTLLKSSL